MEGLGFVAHAVWPRQGSLGEVLSVVSVRFGGAEYFFTLAEGWLGVSVVSVVPFAEVNFFSLRGSRDGKIQGHARKYHCILFSLS